MATETLEIETFRYVGVKRVYDVDPDFNLDFPFDFTEYLAAIDDTLASVEFLVDSRLDIISFGNDSHTATVWLKKTPDYEVPATKQEMLIVTCRITTNSTPARVDDRSIYLYFKER